MSRTARLTALACAAWLGLAATSPAQASTIVNGGFESGFASWVRVDQLGSDGTFHLQTGLASPLNLDPVPAPPSGTSAAMSDGFGPGAHVLYQDFLATPGSQTLSFALFVGNRADRFATPASLDFALTTPGMTLNQQVRVDLLRAGADPFSVAAADILFSLYASQVGDPLVFAGYQTFASDIGAVLGAHSGELLRLRFAETDNLAQLQLGVDNVAITAVSVIPEPTTTALMAVGLAALLARRSRGARGDRRT